MTAAPAPGHAMTPMTPPLAAPVLLVGGSGMLGRAFRQAFAATDQSYSAPGRTELDITRPDMVQAVFEKVRPRTVINCSAWTNVDGAEADEPAALLANGEGPANLARATRQWGQPGAPAVLVHFSTDYVFSGQAQAPYPVDGPLQPLNAYGRTKAAGEEAIRASGCDHLILRTSWLYAPWGTNFVRTIARLGREKPLLKVVSDQRGRPTSAEHLARTTLALLSRGARGLLHATDGGECTWFDFARQIVAGSGGRADVQPCTTAEFPRPARRPAYSVLDLAPTESLIGPMTPWPAALADVLARLEP